MKKKKLFIVIGLTTGVLAVMLIAAPPVFLSSDWGRKFTLGRLNRVIPGELSADDCAVSWWSGTECKNVVYNDEQNMRLDVSGLSIDRSLWQLLREPENLGTVILDAPILVMPEPAPRQTATATFDQLADQPIDQKDSDIGQAETRKTVAEHTGGKKEESGYLHTMQGRMLIRKAAVKFVGAEQPVLRNGDLSADIAAGKFDFKLTVESGAENEKGRAEVTGTLKLPADSADALATDIQLNLSDVQTGPFLALMPGDAGLPQGQGSLSAEIKLKQGGDSGLMIYGPITLKDVDISGGMLGEDHPKFSRLALDFDLQRTEGSWQFPVLRLFSDFGSLDLKCAYNDTGFTGRGKGKIDLAILLTQFPHLFKIRENLRLDRGELSLNIDLEKEGERLRVFADAAVDSLAGRLERESFAWDSPLHLNLDGSMENNQNVEIKKLTLHAPFLDLEGQGDLNRFSLTGSADLDQAMEEISRIIQFDWNAGGRLRLDIQTEKTDDRYTVKAEADIADCQLSHKGKDILPKHRAGFSGQLNTPARLPVTEAEAAELTFDLSSWAGDISGTFSGLHKTKEKISTGYQLQSNLLLGRVTELLHQFELLEQETSMAGTMELRTSGYTEENRLVIRDFDSRIQDFILYRQGRIIRDKDLRLVTVDPEAGAKAEKVLRPLVKAASPDDFFADGGGYNLLDTVNRRLILRDLELTSDFGRIRTAQLALDDWQQKPLPAIKALRINGEADLSGLSALLRQLGITGTEQKFSGAASFRFELTEQPGIAETRSTGHSGTVEIDLDRFIFTEGKKVLKAKEKIAFRSKLHGDITAGDIYFTTFDLQSNALSVQSDGKLELTGKAPHFSLEGDVVPDLAALITLLRGMYPLDFDLKGRKKEAFSFRYSLTDKKQTAPELRFTAKIYADFLSKAGIDVSGLSMDTGMQDGFLSATLKGGLNGGIVRISPRIDYTQAPPLLSLPGPEQVLDHVGLEQPLADGLLKAIHPLFGTLARPSGTINLRAEKFSLSLGEDGLKRADFNISLALDKVVLEPESALAGILDIAGMTEHSLLLKEKNLACEGKAGRVSCSPIKITVADSEMIMSGSTGFDGSLDYVVEVPVTKNLVGKKGYELLKGATLKVPIRGTKERPVYNPEALMQAASDLLGQAAGQAAQKVIKDQMEKVIPDLPGLFEGLLGK